MATDMSLLGTLEDAVLLHGCSLCSTTEKRSLIIEGPTQKQVCVCYVMCVYVCRSTVLCIVYVCVCRRLDWSVTALCCVHTTPTLPSSVALCVCMCNVHVQVDTAFEAVNAALQCLHDQTCDVSFRSLGIVKARAHARCLACLVCVCVCVWYEPATPRMLTHIDSSE